MHGTRDIQREKKFQRDPGNRSKEWLKVKANKRQEMNIGGYTKNDDSSKSFSSLLLGVIEKGKLIYTGKVGTGFNDRHPAQLFPCLCIGTK